MEERIGQVGAGERPVPVSPDGTGVPGPAHLADPRALTILTTEHWSLLTARSLVYNEAFARAGMFLTFLAGSLVALGFVSQAGGRLHGRLEFPSDDYAYEYGACREYLPDTIDLDAADLQTLQATGRAPAALADLVRRRALWNSFIIVARASALAELIERRFPAEAAAFRRLWRGGAAVLADVERLYASLPEIDFSRHVVEGADAPLGVLAVPPCGWSALGTPQRVAAALARLGGEPARSAASDDRPYRHFNLAEAHARLMSPHATASAAQTA